MANQFLREINKTEIEIQGDQKAEEVAKNTSENFNKEAKALKKKL
ncbi:hypothetical protein [Wolbachia pipientis]|nr:hypothetical protein [Wolbachia pipientis]MDM8335285.1 hypothetical protein [Wolbachia pipientis]